MKNIIVYGPGCQRCETVAELVKSQASKLGVPVSVTKETDLARIAMAGVMSTPGLSIDGKLVHSGGVPDVDALEVWLSA